VRHEWPLPAFELRPVKLFGAVWMANKTKAGGFESLKGSDDCLVAGPTADLQTADAAKGLLITNCGDLAAGSQNKRRFRYWEAWSAGDDT
jgi:hypothetical protein